MGDLSIGQVAFNHLGGCRLWEWYRDGLGLVPSGATLFGGPPAAKVNGLPFPLFPGRWLMDGRDWFQLEFFRFVHPRSRPRRADETPADLGYRRVGFHVQDFDAVMTRFAGLGSEPVGPLLGDPGDRRVCLRDPEGNWVELMEADPLIGRIPAPPRPDVPATLRSVTISVPNLEDAAKAWTDGVGLTPAASGPLHAPAHEALWGLEGASCQSLVLDAGGVLVELVEYASPLGRSRSAPDAADTTRGRHLPGHVLRTAFGTERGAHLSPALGLEAQRVRASGGLRARRGAARCAAFEWALSPSTSA